MKVNLDQKLLDFEGDEMDTDVPVRDAEGKPTAKMCPWDLRTAVVGALAASLEEDKGMSADKAVTRWKLAMRLHDGGEQELSPEEATEIRNRLPKCYVIIVAGQACEMLKG